MAQLELTDATLSLGGAPVLAAATLRVAKGERIGLLGRNGEGKSTLLRVLAGQAALDGGEMRRERGLRVGYLPQEVPADLAGTVREVVGAGLAAASSPDDGAWRRSHLVDRLLVQSDLDGDAVCAALSAGQRRRVLLARALAGEPDVLLLDEPTNHLDIDAIAWLEEQLQRLTVTLVFVTHDRAFLRALARRIVELDRGRLRDWECDYDTFLRRREEFLRAEQARWAEFDRKLAQEEIWIRQGVRERRTRNEGRVRALKQMREERRARREQSGPANLQLQAAERSGRVVLRARGLAFAWGGRPLIAGLDTVVLRGDKVGVLGPNGSGKTTLLRLLLGELAPAAGEVQRGTNLQIAYFDQQRRQLDESATVRENVTRGDTVEFAGRPVHVISYLQQFLFTPDRARAPISHLSGGERQRLLLARLFAQPANLLVMDEPTNDLDLETLELLEELLMDFTGTLLLVSHDREFLDNVTTSTLALVGDGRVVETVGGYADWHRVSREMRRAAEPRPAPDRPAPPPRRTAIAEGRRRLGFKEKRELATLPALIEAREADLAAARDKLADPALYRDAAHEVAVWRRRLDALTAELETLYARWEELEQHEG